jgi:hypothetical protein
MPVTPSALKPCGHAENEALGQNETSSEKQNFTERELPADSEGG